MENKTKGSPLTISLLLAAATFAAGFGLALLTTTMQDITANASVVPTDSTETRESIATSSSSSNVITLAEKPFLVEQGKTVAAMPINQTHIQISVAGNGTITLPNSTEIVKTKDTGNAIIRLMPTGEIVQGQIHMSTEDRSENGTVYFTQITQNGKGGIGVGYFSTNSTGKLAFLDNMVAVFQAELLPNGSTVISVFEWRVE